MIFSVENRFFSSLLTNKVSALPGAIQKETALDNAPFFIFP